MTYKHSGDLVYTTSDDYGSIEVVDYDQTIRCLHFGNQTQQATMLLGFPAVLVHKYSHAMLTPLYWQTPAKILMLGLGGGSIVKYLLTHLAHADIHAIELRSKVIDIAHDYFALPKGDIRLRITQDFAENVIQQAAQGQYDLILVDLFLTNEGKDIPIALSEQIRRIKQLLSSQGTLCINVIADKHDDYPALAALRSHFKNRLYYLKPDSSNLIILASQSPIPDQDSCVSFATEQYRGLSLDQYFNELTLIE